jgi:multipile epidermal growth factor-like domains protein 8
MLTWSFATIGIGSFETTDGTRECLWMLKLNESIIDGSLIQLEIEQRDVNISCYNNAVYVFNQIPETSHTLMQKKLLGVICQDTNFPKIIEESKTGQMTIYFQRGFNNEGFNAKISVYSCQLNTCSEPFICDENYRCTCPPFTSGLKCEIEICANNCSESLGQGKCDKNNNRCDCKNGFAGSDCSRVVKATSIVMSEIFSTQIITESLTHLKKTLPRFGHTVNADRRGFLWVFGGYSIANGALNDIRQFDTKNLSWMQVTVDAIIPVGRYFHASEKSKQAIYTFGGLSHNAELLNDFWMFKIQEQRWVEIKTEIRPGFLSGHSLTLVKIGDRDESLFLIGGYSNESVSIAWEYSFGKSWKKLNVSGVGPAAIFGHSSVYHATTQVLYIFGGHQIINDKLKISKKLYSLSYQKDTESWRWSTLPIFSELNRPEENLPRSRFGHSAVGFSQYMTLFGGKSQPHNSSDYLNAYLYKCNSWVRLTESVEIIGQPSEKFMYAQAVSIDSDSDMNEFFVVGGLDSIFSISKISIPADICQMLSSSKFVCRQLVGCSFGQISKSNNTRTTFCFSSDQNENRKNEVSSSFNHGKVCDSESLAQRNCSSFVSCDDCQAVWPQEMVSSCRWSKKCNSNILQGNETSLSVEPCLNVNCSAIDCETCKNKFGCKWTKTGQSFQCLSGDENQAEVFECPTKCSSFDECSLCLTLSASEGGSNECEWSTKMSRCVSIASKSLICSGGTCGLLLNRNESSQCPVSCESHFMCSRCLKQSQCGWCSTGADTGDGLCIDGNLEILDGVCNLKYEALKNISASFEWNFLTCPNENECLNDHHTCNTKTEKCIDLQNGFKCVCADGYEESEDNDCLPVCPLGCYNGKCDSPGKCKCNFGFVSDNCSIECLCSGHSDCTDKLDECVKCKNNTIGKQCEKCDKFYVGDPRNNGKCHSCLEYCNGHTDSCVGESQLTDSLRNLTKLELGLILTEGARSAVCLGCGNFTSGRRCETCLEGHFRGTSNLNEACRKCECNGHGNACDPVNGEKCNCGNNTESDPVTCPAKLDKNSIYHCWMSQCSKCRESYSGHPKNGHQCYKHITIDSKMCLENAKSLDECKIETVPLKGGKTIFFVIQPRFMNVDIRIILDVTVGELDFFMTTNDDSFVVLTNQSNSFHEILLDSKYQWIQEYSDNYSENLNITPLVTSSKKSFENMSIPHAFNDDRGSTDCRSHGKFYVLDKNAQSQTTFVKLTKCNTLLRIFELKNRLVVTLPQSVHNLSGSRFFIALRAANHATATGLLFFR